MPSNLPIVRITIHCTDTPEGQPRTVEQIRAFHTAPPPVGRGWDDIGYHYLIGLQGEIGLGRKEETIPAAVQGYNKGMLAIAYVGGMGKDGSAKDTRTDKQKEAMARLVHLIARKHGLPASAIYGHRDWDHLDRKHNGVIGSPHDWKKQCPCFEVSQERVAWLRG
jgi:hypothetical protein